MSTGVPSEVSGLKGFKKDSQYEQVTVGALQVGPSGPILNPTELTSILADNTANDITGSVTVAADELAIPVTNRIVVKTTGADAEALTLASGVAGQRLTITLGTDGGGTGTLTPATATGFVSVALADAGDTVSLEYVDDTVGWILVGAWGATAQPAVTLS